MLGEASVGAMCVHRVAYSPHRVGKYLSLSHLILYCFCLSM
jgi:hypothetical protein